MSHSMLKIFVIVLSLFLVDGDDENASEKNTTLVTDPDCSIEKYPFVVSIRRTLSLTHFCAGSLIYPDWVVTAAHCTKSNVHDPNYFTIVAGNSKIDKLGMQRTVADRILIHENYNPESYLYDISLIRLKVPFIMSDTVRFIRMPDALILGNIASNCYEATVIGWTSIEFSARVSIKYEKLQKEPAMQCIHLTTLTDEECTKRRYGSPLEGDKVCAGVEEDRYPCQGDSGGPFICNNTLYGVVSIGYRCAVGEQPGYYTRIDRTLAFIKRRMTIHERSSSTVKLPLKMLIMTIITFYYITMHQYIIFDI